VAAEQLTFPYTTQQYYMMLNGMRMTHFSLLSFSHTVHNKKQPCLCAAGHYKRESTISWDNVLSNVVQ